MEEQKSSKGRTALLVFIYAFSLASLIWSLHDADLSKLDDDLNLNDRFWVILGCIAQASAYFAQGLRWKLILTPVLQRPLRPLGLGHAIRAVFAGLFISEILPFRGGEIARCFLVSRWTGLPFSVSIASVFMERVFDALFMWIGLSVAASYMHIPRLAAALIDALGIFAFAGLLVLALGLFRPRPDRSHMPASGWRRSWFILQDDLAMIGHSAYLWAALLQTVVYMALQVVPVWLLFRAYDFEIGIGGAIALMMILRMAAAVPQAPATLGLFQLLTREFVQRGYGVAPSAAARFALVLWAVVKLPVILIGAIEFMVTGAKFRELTQPASSPSNS